MLNIDRVGMPNLNKALREQVKARAFDRCSVGTPPNVSGNPIKAHAVPQSVLGRLIARNNKVYANNPNPP